VAIYSNAVVNVAFTHEIADRVTDGPPNGPAYVYNSTYGVNSQAAESDTPQALIGNDNFRLPLAATDDEDRIVATDWFGISATTYQYAFTTWIGVSNSQSGQFQSLGQADWHLTANNADAFGTTWPALVDQQNYPPTRDLPNTSVFANIFGASIPAEGLGTWLASWTN
jgi:hypothetical protein